MTKLQNDPVMIEQVAWNEYSLLLTDMLQNTQPLHLFTMTLKLKLFTKVIKMPSWDAWVERPEYLLKQGWSASAKS